MSHMIILFMFANHLIRHQDKSKMSGQPGDHIYGDFNLPTEFALECKG